jgi:hypothetical protein
MLIPFLISLLPSLVMGPAWVFEIYQAEIQWQKTQIGLDNAAILLGRNDRDLMNDVFESEARLKNLHKILHKALSCSLVPATATPCQMASRKTQLLIKALILKTKAVAQLKWVRGEANARGNLIRQKINFTLTRSSFWPGKLHTCPFCHLGTHWAEDIGKLKSELRSVRYPSSAVKVAALKTSKGDWSYRLWAQ